MRHFRKPSILDPIHPAHNLTPLTLPLLHRRRFLLPLPIPTPTPRPLNRPTGIENQLDPLDVVLRGAAHAHVAAPLAAIAPHVHDEPGRLARHAVRVVGSLHAVEVPERPLGQPVDAVRAPRVPGGEVGGVERGLRDRVAGVVDRGLVGVSV